MMDIWRIPLNSLWILGLAILLSVLNWAYWVAGIDKARLRTVLRRPRLWRIASLGLVLFCSGMTVAGHTWWERVLWAVLALVCLAQVFAGTQSWENLSDSR